jgi:hypothetical protein
MYNLDKLRLNLQTNEVNLQEIRASFSNFNMESNFKFYILYEGHN